MPVLPGSFDQQAAGVLGTGLGDSALASLFALGVLARHQAEVAAQKPGMRETAEVADLSHLAKRGQGVDPAQASETGHSR